MRVRAIVEIELKSDGTWVISSLESLDTPPKIAPESQKMTVHDHFSNRDRVNDERMKNAEGNSSAKHCSKCGKVHHNVLTHEAHKED